MEYRQPDAVPTTLLGVIFDAAALGGEQADLRCWRMWMERLDPGEMRGAAFYDGPLPVADGQRGWLIVVSGSAAITGYVRDAFSAPDLAAFPGILPAARRFLMGDAVPRELVRSRAYVDEQGRFIPQSATESALVVMARQVNWPVARLATTTNRRPPAPRPPPAAPDQTLALQSIPLEGATGVELRIWSPTPGGYRRPQRRRRLLLGLLGLGVALVALTLGIWRGPLARSAARADATVAPTATGAFAPSAPSALPALFIAPLNARIPCATGRAVVITLTNGGQGTLKWSSDAFSYYPQIDASLTSGVIPPGGSQDVRFTAPYQRQQQTVLVAIVSNGGQAQIHVTFGGC